MASLKEIKTRIQSVSGTKKITSAMKMVASAKLHHAQNAIQNMLPYEQNLYGILVRFLAKTDDINSPYMYQREVRNVAIVAFASNSSLCGAFNNNMIKNLHNVLEEYSKKIGKDHIRLYVVGRKLRDGIAKLGYNSVGDYTRLAASPNYDECSAIASELMDMYIKGSIDRVELLYNHFKNVGTQIYTRENLLPLDINSAIASVADLTTDASEEDEMETNYIIEPSKEEILLNLIPKVLRLKLYTTLLDSNASEHGARTMAMQIATDNADDLLQELNLMFNKTRQQSITNELLDIVAGSLK